MEDHRPISILSSASKVLEAVIRIQLSKYMEKNELLPNNQHGFRPLHSTTTALLSLQNHLLYSHEEGKSTAMLLWDLKSAFDTLDHSLLIKKLELYGIKNIELKLLHSFLKNRKQLVQIGGASSEWRNVIHGSPQGSLLSPLIFTIFAADMELWVKKAIIFSYADDTVSIVSHESAQGAIEALEMDAGNILHYMTQNYLVANPKKMGFMVIQQKQKSETNPPFTIMVDKVRIQESNHEKLLGIMISGNLTFRKHIQGICAKIRQGLLCLRRLEQCIPKQKLIKIADSLIFSHVRYGLAVFGKTRLSKMEPINQEQKVIQTSLNYVLRFLCGKRLQDKESIQNLLAHTGFLSVNQLSAQATLCMAWKIRNIERHPLGSLMRIAETSSTLTTRSQSRGDVEIMGVSRLRRVSFVHQAAQLWNMLPMDIKELKSEAVAAKKIKLFVRALPV